MVSPSQLYHLIPHLDKPIISENINLVTMEADKKRTFIPMLPFSAFLRTVNDTMSYKPEVLRFLRFYNISIA